MKLVDLLQYTAAEWLDDRTDLVAGDGDSLWSDEYLVRQFNEAQNRLCRRAWVIIEYGVAPAARLVLKTGVSLYPLHKSVLRVFDATPNTQVSPLGRTDDIQLRNTNLLSLNPAGDTLSAYEQGEQASLAGNLTNTSGPPLAFATDAGTRTVRVFPPPTSDQDGLVVDLKIARMPTCYLTLDDTDAEPEVPEEWHDSLAMFAAGRALTLPNVDGTQKEQGRQLLAEFRDIVREARQERQRAENSTARWVFASDTAVLSR